MFDEWFADEISANEWARLLAAGEDLAEKVAKIAFDCLVSLVAATAQPAVLFVVELDGLVAVELEARCLP